MVLRHAAWGTLMLASVSVFSVLALGQTRQPAATMDDLLREVQAVRADLKAAAAESLRVQALVARAGLQERRLEALSSQLNAANAEADQITRDLSGRQEQVAYFDDALANGVLPPQMPREDAEAELASLNATVARLQVQETESRGRVHHLSELVTLEHARWEELNRRLDELDRAVAVSLGGSPP